MRRAGTVAARRAGMGRLLPRHRRVRESRGRAGDARIRREPAHPGRGRESLSGGSLAGCPRSVPGDRRRRPGQCPRVAANRQPAPTPSPVHPGRERIPSRREPRRACAGLAATSRDRCGRFRAARSSARRARGACARVDQPRCGKPRIGRRQRWPHTIAKSRPSAPRGQRREPPLLANRSDATRCSFIGGSSPKETPTRTLLARLRLRLRLQRPAPRKESRKESRKEPRSST